MRRELRSNVREKDKKLWLAYGSAVGWLSKECRPIANHESTDWLELLASYYYECFSSVPERGKRGQHFFAENCQSYTFLTKS